MRISRVLSMLVSIGAVTVILGLLGFRFNVSTSLPRGVYRVTCGAAARGSVVYVCPSRDVVRFARARGYLGPGSCPGGVRPLGKLVLAVTGDIVTVSRDEIQLNGRAVPNSQTMWEDSRGRPMPHYPWGTHRLRANELWLFSPYHRGAYDSRYFGPVKTSQVVSVLQPIWPRGGRRKGVDREAG